MPTISLGSTPCHSASQPRSVRIGGGPPPCVHSLSCRGAAGAPAKCEVSNERSGDVASLIEGPARHLLRINDTPGRQSSISSVIATSQPPRPPGLARELISHNNKWKTDIRSDGVLSSRSNVSKSCVYINKCKKGPHVLVSLPHVTAHAAPYRRTILARSTTFRLGGG
jgi:hypothetical protein